MPTARFTGLTAFTGRKSRLVYIGTGHVVHVRDAKHRLVAMKSAGSSADAERERLRRRVSPQKVHKSI